MGHSDADVLGARSDGCPAGAAALGDIGRHFPDTTHAMPEQTASACWKQVVLLLKGKGYSISNIDCTIIAQRPKLKNYIPQMAKNIADACQIDAEQVNVKATTEEQLGFTGSGEGMSAHSVCLITRG